MTADIEVVGLTKRYGETIALCDASFSVAPGRVVALLGLNGAGKSTLLSMMLGLVSGGGSVRYGGRSYLQLRSENRDAVGWALHPTYIPGDITVAGFARASLLLRELPAKRSDIDTIVPEGFGLRTTIRNLSVGMRQRLVLNAAFVGRPQYLLLDEPTNGLDAEQRRAMVARIRGAADAGTTVLVTSHILGDIDRVADDIVVVHQGRIVASAPKTDFVGLWAQPSLLVEVDHVQEFAVALERRRAKWERRGKDQLVVSGMSAEEIWDVSVELCAPLRRLEPERDGLESAFWRLVRATALTQTEQQRGAYPW